MAFRIIIYLAFHISLNAVFGQVKEIDTAFFTHISYNDQESLPEGPNNHLLFWYTQKYIPNTYFVVEHFCWGKWVGILLWRRLSYLLIKKLKSDPSSLFSLKTYIDDIRSKNASWEADYQRKLHAKAIINNEDTTDSKLKELVNEFITYLNENAFLEVFETKELYS